MCDEITACLCSPVYKWHLNNVTGESGEKNAPRVTHHIIVTRLLCHRSFGRCRNRSNEASSMTCISKLMCVGSTACQQVSLLLTNTCNGPLQSRCATRIGDMCSSPDGSSGLEIQQNPLILLTPQNHSDWHTKKSFWCLERHRSSKVPGPILMVEKKLNCIFVFYFHFL